MDVERHESDDSIHAQRKREHLVFAQQYYDRAHEHHYFDEVRPIHTALPETCVEDVLTTVQLADRFELKQPFYIEAMTGGSTKSLTVNRQLAQLACKHGLAIASGSQSIALREQDPHIRESFTVLRKENPDGIVMANLGAHATVEQAKRAVGMLEANALELHINAAQETVMAEGDRDFHWLDHIEAIVHALEVPVIVKEVGFGMNRDDVRRLTDAGVQLINVGGRGGTNFVLIENARNTGLNFDDLDTWGQTTPESLLEARAVVRALMHNHKIPPVIMAAGGVMSPLDIIRAGVLGASAVGVAGRFLDILLRNGYDALDETIDRWKRTVPRLMALLGCTRFEDLHQAHFVVTGELFEYAQQRKLLE